MRGLIVTATVTTPVVVTHSPGWIALDSLLAAAAIGGEEYRMPSLAHEVVVIEIPGLLCAWRNDNGLPLWAASVLRPVTPFVAREYAHRRYPAHRADMSRKASANTSAGQYKEYRKPLRTVLSQTWQATAVGDRAQIKALLDGITAIGARRGAGYGSVHCWDVAEVDAVTLQTVCANRVMPSRVGLSIVSSAPLRVCGWTPPYSHAPWHTACVEPSPCF